MHKHRFIFACLATCLLISANAAAAEKSVTAKVTAVDAAKNSITVEDVDLDVTRKTKITVDGKKATLADIKSGQQVTVAYDDGLEVAISITVGKEAEDDGEATVKAMKAIQGEWVCISGEEGGKVQEKSLVRRENRRLTIKGHSLTMEKVKEGKVESYVGKFEIDASNGHFDWVGKGTQGNHSEWIGIYELDGDILKLCFCNRKDENVERPKTFKTARNTETGLRHFSYTLKRDDE